jgi:hypothetical protein
MALVNTLKFPQRYWTRSSAHYNRTKNVLVIPTKNYEHGSEIQAFSLAARHS